MKFDELRNYLENEIKLGKVTVSNDPNRLGSSKRYQFIAVLSLFENNGDATKEQIDTRLRQLDPTYTGGLEVFTSIVKKKVAEKVKQGQFRLLDYDAYDKRQKTVIINICEEKIQQTMSWVIKPGYLGDNWKEQLEKGIIGIGIRKINLSKYYDKKGDYLAGNNKEIKQELEKLVSLDDFPRNTPNEIKSRRGKIDQMEIALHDVARIQVNDFIYAYDTKKILGIGRVVGDYNYQENENFCHTYKVDWYDEKGRNLLSPKKFPGTIHRVRDHDWGWLSGEGKIQPKHWIYSTTQEHWNIVKSKNVWATWRKIEEINQRIHPKDKVIFYVIGTGEFQGCFEFKSDWYPAKKGVWTDEDKVDYRAQVDLNPLKFGNVPKKDLYDKLDIFKKDDGSVKEERLINLVLKGGNGYPSNGGKPIPESDFNLICKKMEGNEMSSNESLKELSKKTHIKEDVIIEIENELNEQRQIIFEGPPGTSKTFFAREFAKYFTDNKADHVEIIQFHPSYNYEDFVEGIRPKIDKKKREVKGFEIKDGILKSLAKSARYDDSKFVLIIDEINRGKISRIFGELIYLLEYRSDEIRLTYSSDVKFQLPKNLYIIGTMNTADRSIALMDYALRRRFAFFEFEADSEILSKWLNEKGTSTKVRQKVVSLMDDINDTIEKSPIGKECQIGQSYFMKENIDKNKLKKIFKHKILPLLKEYYFADKSQIVDIESKFNQVLENWNVDGN